ncbi:MAG: flippase [Anaerolineae bacterium]
MSVRAKRIAVNSALLFYANVLTSGVSLVVVAILARYLGKAGFGRYGYVISFCEIFVVLSEMGLSKILVREVAQEPERTHDHLATAWTLRMLLSGLVMGILLVNTRGPGMVPEVRAAIWVYAVSQVVFNLTELFNSVFRAYQQMEYQAAVVTLAQVLILVLTLGAIFLNLGLMGVFAATLAANVARFFLGWWLTARRFARLGLSGDVRGMARLFRESFPVGLSLLLRRYIWRGGVVLLATWQGDAAAGILYGPLRVVEQMRIIPMSMVGSILPVLSHRAARSPARFASAFGKSLKVFVILSLPLAVCLSFLAEPIVAILLGEKLAESADILRLLGWAVVFTFPNFLIGTALTAVGKQYLEALGLALGLGAGYAVLWATVDAWGPLGVCWSILTAEGTFLVLGLGVSARYLPWRRLAWPLAKVGLAALLMALVFSLGRGIHFLVTTPVALAVFAVALLALRALDAEEMEAFLEVLPNPAQRWLLAWLPRRGHGATFSTEDRRDQT